MIRFNNENMEVTQINGHAAAYVDGKKRRVVHLFTNKHIFTAATYNGTINDCKNILEQIQLKGE